MSKRRENMCVCTQCGKIVKRTDIKYICKFPFVSVTGACRECRQKIKGIRKLFVWIMEK